MRKVWQSASRLDNFMTNRLFPWIAILLLAPAVWVQADPPLPSIPATNFVVTDFGAIGDGLTNNATAIQNTINAAAGAGGGTVEIPANGTLSTYLCGPINLASGINLQIDSNAMLQMLPMNATTNGSVIIPKWPNASTAFINGSGLQDVEISGPGTIDGQGTNWWFPKASTRPNFINFSGCTRVLVQNVTLQNPPTFHLMLKGNNVGLTIQNIVVNTPGSSPNTDGMDLASTNVLIRDCLISDGDDNIEIGGSSAPAADITISNCTFGTGHGVSMGSLVNGAGGGVHDVIVSNCTFNGTDYGLRIKSDRDRGGLVQHIQYRDITMTNVGYAVVFYSYYNSVGTPNSITPFRASTDTVHAVTGTTPIYQNILISNVTASALTGSRITGILWGLPEMLVSNVTFYDVNISSASNKTFCIYNAQGIQIINSQLSSPTITNSLTFYNAQIALSNSTNNLTPVTLGGLVTPQGTNTLSLFDALAVVTDTNMLGPVTLDNSSLTITQQSASFASPIDVLDASTLAVANGTNLFSGVLAGAGTLTVNATGGGLLVFQADSSGFGGGVTVSNETLLVDNATGSGTGTGLVAVTSAGALGGEGIIGGPVTVSGILAPGNGAGGVLTISNNLAASSGANLDYELGTNGAETIVSGNLALDGTLNISDAGGFGAGTFTLFRYGGSLTTNGSAGILSIGTVPDSSLFYQVDVSSNGFVNLTARFITVASFTASPTNGFAPLTVAFTDRSSGPVTNRFWDFGDGATTNTAALTVDHTYSAVGSYTVELIAGGTDRVSTNIQTGFIVVFPPCTFSLSATNASFSDLGGGGTLTVTPSINACSWTAVGNDSWIQITGGGVHTNGTGVVAYTVTANTASSGTRTGTMTIAGQTFTVSQSGDTTPPSIALTPLTGIVSNTITLVATATDDVSVASVSFYRDGTVLLGSRAAPPYSLNVDTTTLSDGSHCFTARAFDLAGNSGVSGADCVSIENNPPSVPTGVAAHGVSTTQITLSWTASTDPGSGVAFYTVYRDGVQIGTTSSTTFSDTGLSLGTEYCYTVAAHDNVGRVSQPSAPACGQLTTAATLQGRYTGLVTPTNAPTFAASGPIKLTIGNDGVFAARLRLGSVHVAFKGQFDNSGNATVAITQGPLGPLQVTLHLDLAGADQITGTVAGGSFTSQLLATRAAYDRATPCPVSGTYTTIFEPANEEDTTLPQGFGYGTLTVTTTGIGSMSGFLGDGKSLHASAPLSKQNTWPLYVSLYGNQGAALGWVTIGTNGLVGASVEWFRPAKPASPAYPAGFTTNVTLYGNVYTQTVKSVSSFAGNGQLTLGGADLKSNIVEDVYISPDGDVAFALYNAEHLRTKIDPRTGEFKGSFKGPDQNKTVDFKGLVLQIDQYGAGYFKGANGTGFVIIQLVP